MIISGKQIQNVLKIYSDQAKVSNKNAKQTNNKTYPPQDQVILSSQAQEFGQFLQAVKAMPEVRQERVEQLAKQIQDGTYQVESKDIADKILGRMIADKL